VPRINTLSQSARRRGLQVHCLHVLVVLGGVVLGEVITQIEDAGSPVNQKVPLMNLVSDPVISHVHSFGLALLKHVIGNAHGS